MVVCHATTKTFAVQGDVRRNGRHVRTVRVKIDRVDRIGLREARTRAKAIMSQIQSGVDPTAGPEETGITVSQALEAHLGEKPFREATTESYRYNVDHYLARIKNRAVADLSRSEVRDIYDRLRTSKGQTAAICVMRTLRAIINTAMRLDETIPANPVAAIRQAAQRHAGRPAQRRIVQAADAGAARGKAEALGGPAAGALANFEVLDLASAPDFVVRGHEPTRGATGEVL